MSKACLLVGHGTVNSLDELPGFLKNIRRGHDPTPELLAEITHRYSALGEGGSPLNRICLELATKVEERLGIPTRFASRLWNPPVMNALDVMAKEGFREVVLLPLAQFSSYVYLQHAQECLKGINACRVQGGGAEFELSIKGVPNWGEDPRLTALFVKQVHAGLKAMGEEAHVIFTAHSLPMMIVKGGDPYDKEFEASAAHVAKAAALAPGSWELCFQSQGMSKGPGGRPVEWLGPDLKQTLENAKAAGKTKILLAPIGFLADHVEILYDLDIEAQVWAKELGIELRRTESLNTCDEFVEMLAALARQHLG
jgi:protoporphyrin/coproporphyrin ferrochelatase